MYVYIHIYIYIYTYSICKHIYIYIYIHTEFELCRFHLSDYVYRVVQPPWSIMSLCGYRLFVCLLAWFDWFACLLSFAIVCYRLLSLAIVCYRLLACLLACLPACLGAALLLPRSGLGQTQWVFIKGGCSRRGVQWMGVVLYNKTAYNTMRTTTPCFHCTPLWWILTQDTVGAATRPAHGILAIFYPPLKQIRGCVWLCLQAQEGNV